MLVLVEVGHGDPSGSPTGGEEHRGTKTAFAVTQKETHRVAVAVRGNKIQDAVFVEISADDRVRGLVDGGNAVADRERAVAVPEQERDIGALNVGYSQISPAIAVQVEQSDGAWTFAGGNGSRGEFECGHRMDHLERE
jgi:hypothetical protein